MMMMNDINNGESNSKLLVIPSLQQPTYVLDHFKSVQKNATSKTGNIVCYVEKKEEEKKMY